MEKALIWRSGKWLTNISGGMYAENFRRPDTLHLSLPGFDSTRGVYAVNVSEEPHRHWDDFRKYGFLAAGFGRRYSSRLDRLEVGDITAAYLRKRGYLGIGRVTERAVPIKDFRINGRPLSSRMLSSNLLHHADNADLCEYLVKVKWICKTMSADQGQFQRNAGIFAPRPIVVSLSDQPKTLQFLQQQFEVNFESLLAAD